MHLLPLRKEDGGRGKETSFYIALKEGRSLDKLNFALKESGLCEHDEAINKEMMASFINFLHDEPLPSWGKYVGPGTGNSVLHLACWEGMDVTVVERLLQLGANINFKSQGNGYVPLHLACHSGSVELVTLLLDNGCNPNEREDFRRISPLDFACVSNRKNVVKVLLDRGANMHETDDEGSNALHNASCVKDCKDIAELLLDRGANIHEKDNDGWNSLHYASKWNNLGTAELFLDRGINIHEADDTGWTSLHFGSWEGHKDFVQLLLNRGANTHTRNNDGNNSRCLALMKGFVDVATILTRWQFTMAVIILKELGLLHHLACSTMIDLWEFIEENYDEQELTLD